MRLLIAPDSFKGCLSAFDAVEAMRRGAQRAFPEVEVDGCPLSDGGEGLTDVLVAALGGTTRMRRVTGPLGKGVDARWAMLGDGRTAVVEAAAAVGLGLVPVGHRAPLETTTYGVGELILEAVRTGARSVLLGLGGTATTDGGVGMAQALGVVFTGLERPARGVGVGNTRAVDLSRFAKELGGVELTVLRDVDNPLTGSTGAARTYGPQKGATDAEARQLDAALVRLAAIVGDEGKRAGDGAAGGLGYGLRVFTGASVRSGIDYVLDVVRFSERARRCDLVLTGEGRLDAQSSRGKVISGVARRGRAVRAPVVALVGAIGEGARQLLEEGLTAYFSLCDGPLSESDAIPRAAELLEKLAENVVRLQAVPSGDRVRPVLDT